MRPPSAVHNPVLALPAVQAAVAELDEAQRVALVKVLRAIRDEARPKAEESWKKGKGPMAAYWKAVAVYANHCQRAFAPRR